MYLRVRKLKMNKQLHPFELYINLPEDVVEKDLLTALHIPIIK